MQRRHPKFGTLADASGYRAELSWNLAHPEEEELTIVQIEEVRQLLNEVNAYLATAEER